MSNIKIINGKKYPIGHSYLQPKKEYCYKYKDGKYYIYRGRFTSHSKLEGLYNKDGKIYLLKKEDITTKNDKNKQLIDKILKDKDMIINNNRSIKENLSEKDLKNIFTVVISEHDNILVRLVKGKINELKLPCKELCRRFSSPSEWNNFKRALIIRNSISIESFTRWMEILGINWTITFDK